MNYFFIFYMSAPNKLICISNYLENEDAQQPQSAAPVILTLFGDGCLFLMPLGGTAHSNEKWSFVKTAEEDWEDGVCWCLLFAVNIIFLTFHAVFILAPQISRQLMTFFLGFSRAIIYQLRLSGGFRCQWASPRRIPHTVCIPLCF